MSDIKIIIAGCISVFTLCITRIPSQNTRFLAFGQLNSTIYYTAKSFESASLTRSITIILANIIIHLDLIAARIIICISSLFLSISYTAVYITLALLFTYLWSWLWCQSNYCLHQQENVQNFILTEYYTYFLS